jgi:signal transduction histidine kinase
MSTSATALQRESTSRDAGKHDSADVIRHVAHEVRQPLSAIESIGYYLEMVLPRTETKARAQAGKLRKLVEQANWILEDAVHFLQANEPRLELTDVNEVLSDSLADSHSSEQLPVEPELQEDLPLLRLDIEQTRHMIRNLLMFFRRIMRPAAPLGVCTWREEKFLHIEFRCPCSGALPDDPAALFEPFAPHSPACPGLALASVRRIVHAHGGRIALSRDPNQALLVELAFPIAD